MLQETSDVDRQRIIDSHNENIPVSVIAEVLRLKRTTLHGIIRTFLQEGRITKKARGGPRGKKLTPDQEEAIRSFVDQDCSISLRKLKEKCAEELHVNVSEKTIDRTLSTTFRYTLKRTHSMPERRNDDAAIRARVQYAELFMELYAEHDENKFFFVDEVGFSVSMRSRRGRSAAGTRAVHVVRGLRTKNMSVCCVMSREGIINYKVQPRAFNNETFVLFVGELLGTLRAREIADAIPIMDNVPFHRNQGVRRLIEESGHRLLLLPPYSPFLNPIENAFSKWKHIVRQARARNEAEILELMDVGHREITAEDCGGYYRHMFRFMARCIRGEAIIDE